MRWATEQRLNFIAERIAAEGFINRKHLIDKFSISVPQASADLQRFMTHRPGVMTYNKNAKRYEAKK